MVKLSIRSFSPDAPFVGIFWKMFFIYFWWEIRANKYAALESFDILSMFAMKEHTYKAVDIKIFDITK